MQLKNQNTKHTRAGFVDQNILKSVLKDVVAEDDSSRNMIIFGPQKISDELIDDKAGFVMQEIGLKPKVELTKLHRK